MSPFSIFSSVSVSDRVASFREAETHLFGFAKTRFAHHAGQDEENHHFELFDTPIKVPSVIKDATCQVHEDSASDSEGHSLHGVKVVNKRLSSGDGNGSDPTSPPTKQAAPLVLLHGYANGSLYFYRNLMGLSHHFGSIYALDMLGWGMSSRPKFDLLTDNNTDSNDSIGANNSIGTENGNEVSLDTQRQVSSAESFFVESLESWRQQHDLPKLTLAGHSMGGYLSVAYAERYPQHVERLILLSPVGVPEKRPEDENRISSMPFYVRAMVKTSRYLFNKGITPGAFLRSLPSSRSKAMVDGYILNRLPAIQCEEERKHLGEYLYQNSMLPGSGECCLSEILTAGAFAKIPLVHRVASLQSDTEEGMEVHFVYGQNDWMDYRGGLDVQRLCHNRMLEREESLKEGKKQPAMPPKVSVHGVSQASHLLMLDNYEEFNAALIIAAGGEESLSPSAPRPAEFVCDEVARSSLHKSRTIVADEAGALEFFRGPLWNRRFGKKAEDDEAEDGQDVGAEEKKMEEQLAR